MKTIKELANEHKLKSFVEWQIRYKLDLSLMDENEVIELIEEFEDDTVAESSDELGLKHKTDKSSITHGYLDTYEKYFSELRDKEFVLLELGVAAGNSIRLWREYFAKAKVYGIDNNPDCEMDGVYIGSQTDMEFIDYVLAISGTPNIIIDDCSHEGKLTIETFKYLFPKIAKGGFYFIEDTATFYSKTYSGEFESNGRSKVYNFFTDLAYHVDVAGRGMCGSQDFAINHPTTEPPVPEFSRLLKAIHIHTSLWIFERK